MLMLLVMLDPKHLCIGYGQDHIIFGSDIYNAPVEYIWCDIYINLMCLLVLGHNYNI